MRALQTILVLALLLDLTWARDELAKPDTPEQAAEKVQAAFGAEDQKVLKALAEKDDPDPWLVADELCSRGERDAALAFAEATPGKDTERLPGYVASCGKGDPKQRQILSEANGAARKKDYPAALELLKGAPDQARDVITIRLLFARALTLGRLRRGEEASGVYRSAAEASERIGWLRRAGRGYHWCGRLATRFDFQVAIDAWQARLRVERARGNRQDEASTLKNLGIACRRLGRYERALELFRGALEIWDELGDRRGTAGILMSIGHVHQEQGEFEKARELLEQSLKLREEIGDGRGTGQTLSALGTLFSSTGDYGQALEHLERALGLLREARDRRGAAAVEGNIASVHILLGDYASAQETLQAVTAEMKAMRDRPGLARGLSNLARVHYMQGRFRRAIELFEESLGLYEGLGEQASVAWTHRYIGLSQWRLGNPARALTTLEESLELYAKIEDGVGESGVIGNLGSVYQDLGDYETALDHLHRSFEVKEASGDRRGAAVQLGNIANVHFHRGDFEKALEIHEQALARKRKLGDRNGAALTLANIGAALHELGRFEEAVQTQQEALEIRQELGDRLGIAGSLNDLGAAWQRLGRIEEALESCARSLEICRELGTPTVDVLWNLATAHLARGDAAAAARAAREAVDELSRLMTGLADEDRAMARERYHGLFEVGVEAGLRLEDLETVCHFLESGRAGALLAALGGRDVLLGELLPEGLRGVLAKARGAEAAAAKLLDRARTEGRLKEVKARRAEWEAAREKVRDAVRRIQREERAAADLLFSKADPLAKIGACLEKHEALVLYGKAQGRLTALVVRREGARTVRLADAEKIEGLVRTTRLDDPASAPAQQVAALRKAIVDPLGLGEGTARLLVSPCGVLAEVPIALLTDLDVAYVPSGTTLGVLRDEPCGPGDGVLALGDPDYDVATGAVAKAAIRRGRRLTPLPSTRAEAGAVGDVVLLGKDATEPSLAAALAKRGRWRALHLACHGLIDSERPTLSSLAITPDPENDGLLTCLEVFRMRVSADLVALSACETAKGKVYQAEGVVGLTRAFMMADAPRVLCSLWRVDDEATKALMVKFYELWNPKDGKKGMGAAAALRKAQEFIRGHEKWKHPYYWAAWVLWGLPE
ncbi:MAG: tetratricopeptide repeat protein [Planctomycetota bacterium]|jgi:tetratricopeptide (TPR) repeat protein